MIGDNLLFIFLFIIELIITIIFFIEILKIQEELEGARLSIMLLEESKDDDENKAFIRYCISVLSSFDTIEEVIDYMNKMEKCK